MILLEISIIILIFLTGFNLKFAFNNFEWRDHQILNKLFFWHFTIAVGFHFYIENYGGDAIHYWYSVKTDNLEEILSYAYNGSAASILQLLNYIPSKVLQLSFFAGNMLYALLGYIGFVLLYKTVKHLLPEKSIFTEIKLFNIPLFPWLFFLPNLHFWSSGIGKDTILFFSIALFIYSLLNIKKRFIGMGFALLLSLLIRPHISLFLLASMGFGYLIDGKLPGYQKVFMFLIFLIGFVSIFNYVLDFVRLESLETEAIEEYASKKASSLNQARSGSGLDISEYPYPIKVFTFLFRPLFFDNNGVLAILSSFENLILIILTIKAFRNKFFFHLKSANYILKGMFIYFLLGTFSFALILGNLGIMLRQKNQFFPAFLIVILYILYSNYIKSNTSMKPSVT